MLSAGHRGLKHPGGMLHSSESPLDSLVRRTSSKSRRTPAKVQLANSSAIPPSLQPHYAPSSAHYYASLPRPFAGQQPLEPPDSPLLHTSFRSSTASAVTNTVAVHTEPDSTSFLSLTDEGEQEDYDGLYYADDYGGGSHDAYGDHHNAPFASATPFESQTGLWPQAVTGPTDYVDLEDDIAMPPPSPLPAVVVSSPQDDPKPSGPMRQPIVSQAGFPRLNFSRPGRPPILSSDEQKRRVLERNACRTNSPATGPSASPSLSPVTPVMGVYPDDVQRPGARSTPSSVGSPSSSYLHPNGAHPFPAIPPSSHITLLSHPPSLRVGSPSSLYSNSYSFYQLDSVVPSPTSQSPRSTPDVSPASSRPPSAAAPRAPEEFLQLGIQYHEQNNLKDSAVFFEKSAKEQGGCGVGMLMWGLTLRHGWGCEKNEKGGFKWLTKAAEAAVEDLEKAKKGFDAKGVKEELVLAIYEVGQCFFHGWGVAKDQKMAISYYRVAANLGDTDAQQDLAFCLANGKGCKKNKKEAAKWYRAAVAQGASDVGMAWIHKEKYKD